MAIILAQCGLYSKWFNSFESCLFALNSLLILKALRSNSKPSRRTVPSPSKRPLERMILSNPGNMTGKKQSIGFLTSEYWRPAPCLALQPDLCHDRPLIAGSQFTVDIQKHFRRSHRPKDIAKISIGESDLVMKPVFEARGMAMFLSRRLLYPTVFTSRFWWEWSPGEGPLRWWWSGEQSNCILLMTLPANACPALRNHL